MTNHTLMSFRGVKRNVVIKYRVAGLMARTPQSSYPPITPIRVSSSI